MHSFSTVEINQTFYRLPTKKTFQKYYEEAPKNFVFSVKASRYITHVKKLKDPSLPLRRFFSSLKPLKKTLGPILFQFPPLWKCNIKRLDSFLAALPRGHRYTFEFRNPTWFTEEVFSLLKEKNIALCLYEFDHTFAPRVLTSKDFLYVRLHGPKGPYQGKYPLKTLKEWANFFKKEKRGRDIYCYFDNDEKGYAPLNALELKDILKLE